MNRYLLFLSSLASLLLDTSQGSAQQLSQYSQYMFNQLVVNPAFAGAEGPLSVTVINRNQWTGFEGAPRTQTLVAHSLFKEKHVGIGATLSNDKIGVHQQLNASLDYAYHLHLGNSTIVSFGLQGSFHQVRSDYASLVASGDWDPLIPNTAMTKSFLDVATGVFARGSKWRVGLSLPALIPQRISVNDSVSLTIRTANLFVFTAYRIALTNTLELEPSTMVKYYSGVPLSYDVNINTIYRNVLTCGLSYRKKSSLAMLLSAQVTNQLRVGYSYDYPLFSESVLLGGAHEIMALYLFRFVKSQVQSPR